MIDVEEEDDNDDEVDDDEVDEVCTSFNMSLNFFCRLF